MDERHWWFATKLQETFHIGAQDSPTMLEDFMAQQTTLDYINDFLAIGGHTKLFFYSTKPSTESLVSRRMFVTNTTAKLREVLNEECICLYFLRSDADHVIDSNRVEKEVFCGEIKESPLLTLSLLVSSIFVPVLRAQKNWECPDEGVTQFFNQLEKLTTTLSEYSTASVAPQPILRRAGMQVSNDFKQNRAAAINPMMLAEYEALVTDWSHTIESILGDGTEDRTLDGIQGPLTESDTWHRRQKHLVGITEQLKTKECKGVIGILITGKSKVLKRWKFIDASITDAFNETKDKVKYLDTLRKYFEQLYLPTITVSMICNSVLPSIMTTVRQMDSISRYYAKNGYLGLLFTKVTNQLAHACRQYVNTAMMKADQDCLWSYLEEEINSLDSILVSAPAFVKLAKGKLKKQGGAEVMLGTSEDSFPARLQACLVLQKQYRDMVRTLRDNFGACHSTTLMSNSITPATSPAKRSILQSNLNSPGVSSQIRLSSQVSTQGHARFKDSDSGCTQQNSGVSLTDEETVFGAMDVFCARVRNMIDIMTTLRQFTKLCKTAEDLPRLPRDALLVVGDENEDRVEEEEEEGGEIGHTLSEGSVEEEEFLDESPSVSCELRHLVRAMKTALLHTVTARTFLDTRGKDREMFEEGYAEFVGNVRKIEAYICQYLQGIFTLKMNSERSLQILAKFDCVMNRVGLKSVFSDKYVAVFSNFDDELEEVQNLYETQKESPPLSRNAPIVSGAICWSRGLLRKIEEPMKMFKENKYVTSLRDFGRIVKFYNRIATALVKFESLWLTMWKSRIESARVALKLPLLAHHFEMKELVVNADERVVELIQECKGLLRFDIQLPENAMEVLKQEKRFKNYKQHLEFVLKDYNDICSLVPTPLAKLLQPHMDNVLQYLQPGLANLTWNSMNIDAYLHQVHLANMRLRNIVESVNKVVDGGIFRNVGVIERSLLFDRDLAYSQRWSIESFRTELKDSIKTKQQQLAIVFKTIENSIQDVISIATQNRSTSSISPSPTPRPSLSPRSGRYGNATQHDVTSGRAVATSVSGLTDESLISEIYAYYCGLAHGALLKCISSSLQLFYHCVCPVEIIRDREQSSATSSRPTSAASNLSSSSEWSVAEPSASQLLKFEVEVKFNIPDIVIAPTLSVVQSAVSDVATAILDVSRDMQWWALDTKETLHTSMSNDSAITELLESIADIVTILQNAVDRQLLRFRRYDFLWKEDMHGLYQAFVDTEPSTNEYRMEVDRLQRIEQSIGAIPVLLAVGSISLNTTPIKDSLHGLAVAWKIKYSTELHEEAKTELQKLVEYREQMKARLSQEVVTLENLNNTLKLLHELNDKDNAIDEVYLPVENSYSMLREYNLSLPRSEVEEVKSLRDRWQNLIELAEQVRSELMVEKRNIFEQELDKDVKRFVVEVIQFRNSFDSQGPGVVGVSPGDAVERLHNFQQAYAEYEAKRKILDAVQLIFGVTPTLFPELDRTGEELVLLGLLYGLFQQYISFDESFRDKLWADVDLIKANREVEDYWQQCLKLPPRIQEWQAYKAMKYSIEQYLNVFPILHKLASKEIRNRHWLQVMSVTGSSFQLEANVFKLSYLLDIELIKHENEIKDICSSASRELELEVKMRSTEEEWTEQVMVFDKLKEGALYCLSNNHTEGLLELLEDAQGSLAVMLTSKYIGPLRHEAAAWAIKLKEIGEVLEQWLAVQDFWRYLKTVFTDNVIAKELPQECSRFARIDKNYMKMTKRAQDTKNVLQCCVGGDVPKIQVLRHMYEELDVCFKSLHSYLDAKRKAFPRFYFVSDPVLLAILSQPYTLDSVKPHLKSLFIDIYDVILTTRAVKATLGFKHIAEMTQKPKKSSASEDERLSNPRPSQYYSSEHEIPQSGSRNLSSAMALNAHTWRKPTNDAVAIVSEKGELLKLKKEVFLSGGVELWLSELLKVVQDTVRDSIKNCVVDVKTTSYIDEIAQKYPPQVAYLGLLFMWTRECETAINDIRIDRKAIPNAIRRFWSIINRLPNILVKYCWRNSDQKLTMASQANLEGLLAYGMYLRDVMDDLGKRKLRDVSDFEWRRNTRFYGKTNKQEGEGKSRDYLLHMLENDLQYGNEFYGSRIPVTITPGTERFFLALSLAKSQFQCGAIVGESNCGKTETAKGLAQMLGHYFLSLSCTPNMDHSVLSKIMHGLAQDGCWGIFDEFHRASPAVVEVLLHHVRTVVDAVKTGKKTCWLDDGKEITIKPSFNVILTANSKYFTMTTELKAYFRSVAMVMPDISLILRAHCAGQGLKSPKVLGDRLTMVAKICQDQLSHTTAQTFSLSSLISVVKTTGRRHLALSGNQTKLHMLSSEMSVRPTSNTNVSQLKSSKVSDKDKKPPTPSQLTQAAKLDHYLTLQVLQEYIGPRLSQEDLGIFNSVVRDVFVAVPSISHMTEQSLKERQHFESMLVQNVMENGLVPRRPWIDKIMQLYHLASINNGILLAGSSGSGKTACLTSLVETLSRCSLVKHGNTGSQVHTHKLQHIHPLSVSDLALMFGSHGPAGDWVDGIFTSSWKKATKTHNVHRTTTWLCMDGPLHAGWAENLCSVFDDAKYLTLDNCERLHSTDDVKIVFETDELSNASPAIVSRTAVVFMDDDVLGWRPLAESWLNNRPTKHRECIEKTLNNTVDTICQLVLQDMKPLVKISEIGLFSTSLALLQALLENNTDIAGDLHIERLTLFSLIWSFGILLPIPEQKKLSETLLSLCSGLPDYDEDISIFDYYVDESGEWEMWRSRVSDESYFDAADLLGELFVETNHTNRVRFLMELAKVSRRNILLVGPSGSGKTSLMNDFLDKQVSEEKTLMVRRYVYSGISTAAGLQRFIESNIHHRQGYDYGARGGKRLHVFIEDLNLPTPDEYGVQHVNELLRQVVGDHALYKLQKPFERRQLEDIFVAATMNMSFTSPAVGKRTPIPERLKRHFAVFRLPAPTAKTMFAIVTCVLEGNMSHNQGMGLPQELHEQIVEATCALIHSVQHVLRPSPTPGRTHYNFNLQDVARIFQGLKTCPEEMRADEDYVLSLWQHETQRVMGDRISRTTDMNWFERNLKTITKQFFPDKPANSPPQLFVTFPTDTKQFYSGRTITSSRTSKGTHEAVQSLDDVIPCLHAYLKRYNDEFSGNPLCLMLSSHCISHVIRVHRILSIKNRGNLLLVGSIGSRLSHLAALALYMLDYPIHPVDCSHLNTFLDSLRSAVRRAGCDGKTTTLKFTERDLVDETYFDAINSLLISGEYSLLFSEDETNSLLQALMPSIKRKFSNFLTDPMKFFLTRVKRNLHIILCLQPTHKLVSSAASHYPGILSGCHINWIQHCAEDVLIGKAKHFLQKYDLFQEESSTSLRSNIVSTLASIHAFVVDICHQVPYEGNSGAATLNTRVSTHELRPSQKDLPTTMDSDESYTKNLLKERIALAHRGDVNQPIEMFVGPKTYDRFLHCFKTLLGEKQTTLREILKTCGSALSTVSQAHKDAETLKEHITKTKTEYEEATVKTASLLEQLTAKSTTLERLKARLGVGSETLRSFIEMIDNEMEFDEDVLLPDDEKDELDVEFERMKLAKFKSKRAQTREEIAMAHREEERLRVDVEKAREQVLLWQERLDRCCCERFKAIQNPPAMANMVMLMTMVLLGKHEFSPFNKSDTGHKYVGILSDGKCDKTTWKAIQQIMGDSQKFSEALHNLDWQEGLPDDIVAGIRPFFFKNKDGELGKDVKTVESPKPVASPDVNRFGSITVTAARYSSEDVVILVEYVLALLHYTDQYKPYKKSMDYIASLYAEEEVREKTPEFDKYPSNDHLDDDKLPDSDPEPELTEADLPRLEQELTTLQDKFDEAVMIKYDLQEEVDSSSERLRVAQQLLERFRTTEKEFRVFLDEYSTLDVLLANCLSASAFLSYCGPLRTDLREKLMACFSNATLKYGLPRESKQVFYDLSLCEYLNGKIAKKLFEQMKLPTDKLMLDNMCVGDQMTTCNSWTLMCDPHRVAQALVQPQHQAVTVKYKEIRNHLETCLMEGTKLVVTDVDVEVLADDDRFYHVFRNKLTFLTATNPFKLLVGEHEIECQPSFRMYMCTTSAAYQVPRRLCAFLNVLDICLSRQGLEDQLLDRFMELEKPRVQDTRYQTVLESVRLLNKKKDIETKFLKILIENVNFVRDLGTMKKIASMKRSLEETIESISRVEQTETSLLQSREAFRPIARRAAVFFDVIRHMEEINTAYKTSWAQFLKVFDVAIKHSERTAVKAVAERVGLSAFSFAVQGFRDNDKLLFAVMSAIEVEDSCGHVNVGDREFLIHPAYGAAVKSTVNNHQSVSASQTRIMNAKKPFDWLSDEQFGYLQLLAQWFDWFQDSFEKMNRDGRETQWRQLIEHDIPELVALPDNLDERFTPIQRFMVIRAIRPDRLVQAARSFIIQGLGRRYASEIPLDLAQVSRQTDLYSPILLLYDQESCPLESLVRDLAAKKQVEVVVISLTKASSNQERTARRTLHKAMQEGHWVVFLDGHCDCQLLETIDSILADNKQPEPSFRLWISATMSAQLPANILQFSVKIFADSPQNVRGNLIRSMSLIDDTTLNVSERSEWPALLHNVCMLHNVIRLRSLFHMVGWNKPDEIRPGAEELSDAIKVASLEFGEQSLQLGSHSGTVAGKSIQWNGLRYLLSEVVYGKMVSDEFDRNSLSALVDYWISPAAVKKEFEASRMKYRLPSVFFLGNARLPTLVQSLESLPSNVLDVPEACGLHSCTETVLATDQYVFTHLNSIYDHMQVSETLSQACVETEYYTPTEGIAVVSGRSQLPGASWITVEHAGAFASASLTAQRQRKDVELHEICNNALGKLPKPWSKETITERFKRGGVTSFNLFILAEVEHMQKLIQEIRDDLQLIKASSCEGIHGDQLPYDVLVVADALFRSRIPAKWLALAGNTAPPVVWSLMAWLADIQSRYAHIERVFSQGRDRIPAYWLGAFFNPKRLLSIIKQESVRNFESSGKTATAELFVFQTEITGRDKDHLREPPLEGIFVYGLHMWGCAWEKTTGDLLDAPPRHGPTPLPVVHITAVPQSEKQSLSDPQRSVVSYACPCYPSRVCERQPVVLLDIDNKDVSATRWPLRGLSATLRPF